MLGRLATLKTVLLFTWGLLVISGFIALLKYGNTAGGRGQTPSQWPPDTRLSQSNDKPTLLVFIHPQCSCSSATIGELERIMTDIAGKARVQAVFYRPKDKGKDWLESVTW